MLQGAYKLLCYKGLVGCYTKRGIEVGILHSGYIFHTASGLDVGIL